jgi:hypothetical protein
VSLGLSHPMNTANSQKPLFHDRLSRNAHSLRILHIITDLLQVILSERNHVGTPPAAGSLR